MAPRRVRTVEGTCWQCKTRRVLCDLAKPGCGRCVHDGHICDYSEVRLRWTNGVASRGRLSGLTLPVLEPQKDLVLQTPQKNWEFRYFELEILPRFSMLDAGLDIDCSSFAAAPAVAQAISAISNAHRLFRGHITSPSALEATKQARFDAIKAFRENLEIADLQDSTLSTKFSINVLLCILDGMVAPQHDDDATSYHFAGGKAIMQSSERTNQIMSANRGALSLFLSIFATIDLTHAILSGHLPYFNQDAWKRFFGKEAWWTGLGEFESIFIETMGVLAHLAVSGHSIRYSGRVMPVSELLSTQLILERLRKSLAELVPKRSKSDAIANPTLIHAFCATYITTGNIYMYRALGSLEVRHDLIQQSVRDGLRAASECRGDSKLIHCLLFPLLVVGSHTTDETQQLAIKQALLFSADYLSFGSIKVTLEFLQRKWTDQETEVDWWTFFEPLAKNTFLF